MAEKEKIRRRVLRLRNSLPPEERREKSKAIKERLFTFFEFKTAKIILLYAAKGSEVETKEMLQEALSSGKKVGLPITKGEDLLFSQILQFKELSPSTFGILEPKKKYRPLSIERVDLVIVPGIAFDTKGNRIGFGGGFYDRFLSKIPKRILKIGLVFELQVISESLPSHRRDVAVDKIITEKRVIDCGV
ncbi:MAG: 5-formyltetrahydrofolate cyclo-ligase [Candidatus Omnitrophica bacterium]|nr:5-formyltetrahydrofolate cyclo-ligase [Candidatus Omnitrophota bacterium]